MRQPRGLHLCAGDWSRKDTRSPERLSYVFRITCGLPKRDRPHQTSAPPAPFGLSPSVEPREGGLGLPSALPRKTEDGVFSEQRKLAFFPLEEIPRSRGGGESEEDEDADSESAGQTPMEERCSPHSDAVDSRSTNMQVGADGDKTARGGKGIDRPVASLFASPPPERQFQVNTISARSRPPRTHTQPGRHWAGIPFERFHIRLAFDQDSEMIAFLESLTDQQGQRTLQIVRDGFRQLITDVLDYRGVVPHSGERQWTVGTDKSSDGDRAASLDIGISVEGQEEVVFMMGMHLRRLDKKVKPSVEDLEFWVDRRYMEEVLEEWGQAPKEMVDLVRRCRRVESRRATDLWRFALKVDLDAQRAAQRVGWALPKDQKEHRRYLVAPMERGKECCSPSAWGSTGRASFSAPWRALHSAPQISKLGSDQAGEPGSVEIWRGLASFAHSCSALNRDCRVRRRER